MAATKKSAISGNTCADALACPSSDKLREIGYVEERLLGESQMALGTATPLNWSNSECPRLLGF